MFLVGLTGGISTGKTTVSKMFRSFHVPVIDADLLAREGNFILNKINVHITDNTVSEAPEAII